MIKTKHIWNSAKDFSRWQQSDGRNRSIGQHNMLTGRLDNDSGFIGTPQNRQDALVGLMINAAITTSVYEELKQGKTVDNLMQSGFLRNAEESNINQEEWLSLIRELTKKVSNAQENGGNDDLFAAVCTLFEQSMLKYDVDMSDEAALNIFKKRDQGQKVEDPRIANANHIIQGYFNITSSGEKAEESLKRKIANRMERAAAKGIPFNLASDIRDNVRIRVGAESPEIAKDFFRFLEYRMKPKEVDGVLYPRAYQEPWDIKEHGQFDCTSYVVMDRLHNPEQYGYGGELSYRGESGFYYLKGVNGIIAEIRMIPKEMEKFEDITHALFAMQRALKDLRNGHGILKAGNTNIHTLYEIQKEKFDAEKIKLGVDYTFPAPPAATIGIEESEYDNYIEEYATLNATIQFDALSSAKVSDEWKEEVLRTVYKTGVQISKDRLEQLMPDTDHMAVIKDSVVVEGRPEIVKNSFLR